MYYVYVCVHICKARAFDPRASQSQGKGIFIINKLAQVKRGLARIMHACTYPALRGDDEDGQEDGDSREQREAADHDGGDELQRALRDRLGKRL